jgi:hypothetical protein
MNLDDDYDPHKPDLALVCQGGKVVRARAFLLMLASDPKGPLMPAIKMALRERTSTQQSTSELAPAGPSEQRDAGTGTAMPAASATPSSEPHTAATGSSGSAADDGSGLARLQLDQDRSEDWQLLLSCMDYPHALVKKPEVDWVGCLGASRLHYAAVVQAPCLHLVPILCKVSQRNLMPSATCMNGALWLDSQLCPGWHTMRWELFADKHECIRTSCSACAMGPCPVGHHITCVPGDHAHRACMRDLPAADATGCAMPHASIMWHRLLVASACPACL